jgi:hypothetical protein
LDKVTTAIGFNHDPTEPISTVVDSKNITGDGQTTKGIFRREIWFGVVLIGHFDKRVIDIIARDDRFYVRIGEYEACQTWTVCVCVALEPMVARKQMTIPEQDTRVAEPLETIVADLGVIGVYIERDGLTRFRTD